MAPAEEDARRAEELAALLREVRERVRERYPEGAPGGMPLADLMPLVHARDAAEAKVAAIGSVNPRRGGPLNHAVQWLKRLIARALDWHVREQVAFNRGTIASINAAIEALNEVNRALAELSKQAAVAREALDVRSHWEAWRSAWEQKLAHNEMQFLRSVADLQAAYQHRADLMESNFRELVRSQHADFTGALERATLETQKRLWADLERVRLEYEALIHNELRVVRQRAALAPPAVAAAAPVEQMAIDYARFAERFRGSEEYVRNGQKFYAPFFAGCRAVLDLGCGRGEFLELMREGGVPARGIDCDAQSIALCRHKGLDAEPGDLFAHLSALADGALDGIFCAQVVEHLPPARLPELIALCAAKLRAGGVLAIETPNPECLAVFAIHFYLDPTHQRPLPHPLLAFYLEECGFGGIEVHKRSPAVESFPALAALPEDFREAFFGGLDYCIIGRRLG
ncbi:MAG: methyltransferase domain-containing protein [Bryobacteraceae bacterium]